MNTQEFVVLPTLMFSPWVLTEALGDFLWIGAAACACGRECACVRENTPPALVNWESQGSSQSPSVIAEPNTHCLSCMIVIYLADGMLNSISSNHGYQIKMWSALIARLSQHVNVWKSFSISNRFIFLELSRFSMPWVSTSGCHNKGFVLIKQYGFHSHISAVRRKTMWYFPFFCGVMAVQSSLQLNHSPVLGMCVVRVRALISGLRLVCRGVSGLHRCNMCWALCEKDSQQLSFECVWVYLGFFFYQRCHRIGKVQVYENSVSASFELSTGWSPAPFPFPFTNVLISPLFLVSGRGRGGEHG